MDLLTAVQTEPLSKIQDIVLKKGLSFNSRTGLDYDALNRALECKRKDVAKWLIKFPCRVNKVSNGNRSLLGNTPLHNAVKLDDIEIIEMLLKNEASIVAVDSDDNTALHLSFLYRHNKITDLLLGYIVKMSNYTNVKNNEGLSHLHVACTRNNIRAVEGFVIHKANVADPVKTDSLSSWAGYTPLHFAIEFQLLEAAKMLLAASGKVTCDKSDNAGHSPLQLLHQRCKQYHMAALHLAFYKEYHMSDRDGAIVDYLYKAMKDKEKNVLDKNKLSYFHVAVTRNDFHMVKIYLDKGANINQSVLHNDRGFSGYTALHFAVTYRLEEMAKFLIEHGADVNAAADGKRKTPLYEAFQIGNISLIELLFESGGRLDKSVNYRWTTLLHCAAEAGSHEIVQYLLDSGNYTVDARNGRGQTPLIACLKADTPSKKVIEILLEARASTRASCKIDGSVLDIVNSSLWLNGDMGRFAIYKTFLEKASILGCFQLLARGNARDIQMLLQTGVDLYKTYGNTEYTLVHMLTQNHSPGVFEQLYGRNFDVNACDRYGRSCLMYATINDNPEAVQFLINKGADIEAAEYVSKITPLYYACWIALNDVVGFFRETVRVLLESGANAQVELANNSLPTILDPILKNQTFRVGDLAVAHLALQEANGTTITRLIRSKIESYDGFKNYFENCKKQLSVEVYRSVTVLDILAANERKLERYFRNEEMAAKLMVFKTTIDYFDTILSKRFTNANFMVGLRKNAAPLVCRLMKMDYNRFPCIADEIVKYLVKQDLEYLISIEL